MVDGHKGRAAKAIEDIKNGGVTPTENALGAFILKQPGDPDKTGKLLVEALAGCGRWRDPGLELPPKLLLGKDAYGIVGGNIDGHRKSWEEWKALATDLDCDD